MERLLSRAPKRKLPWGAALPAKKLMRWVRSHLPEGPSLFPFVGDTARALADMFTEARTYGARKKRDNQEQIDAVTSEEMRNARKNILPRDLPPSARPKYRYRRDSYPNLPPEFSYGLSFYVSFTRHVMHNDLFVLLRRLFPSNVSYSREEVVSVLKLVSELYKKFGPMLDARWRYFVNLETMGGYKTAAAEFDLVAEARRWVGERTEHNEAYLRDFAWRARRWDRLISWEKPVRWLSPEAFALDPTLYSTTGSGSGLPRLEADVLEWDTDLSEYRPGLAKLKSSKWAGYLAMKPKQIVRLMMRRSKQRNRIFRKPDEPTKDRTIVVTDPSTNLKMAYVNFHITQLLDDVPELPLGWSSTYRTQWLARFGANTATDRYVHMPIDQSAFDENVDLRMILDAVTWMGTVFSRLRAPPELIEVVRLLHYALDGGTLSIDDVIDIIIMKGIISGWVLTALLGTLCNYMQAQEIFEYQGVDVLGETYSGDDVALLQAKLEDSVRTYLGYKEYGLNVNPAKFWISHTRDEFLRMVAEEGSVRGYPARAVTGLLYLRPGSRPARGIDGVKEQSESWQRFIGRGADPLMVERAARAELMRVTQLPEQAASEVLHTPASLGGLGWAPFTSNLLSLVPTGRVVGPRVERVDSPLLTELGLSAAQQAEYVTSVLGATLEAPPARARRWKLQEQKFERHFEPFFPVPITAIATWPEPPRPIFITYNGVLRHVQTQEMLEEPEKVRAYLQNADYALLLRGRIGHAAWRKWLVGSIVPGVVSPWNQTVTAKAATSVAGRYWRLLGRMPRGTWSATVEGAVHAYLSEQKEFYSS